MHRRQRAVPDAPPRREREIEGGDLGAPMVELQSEQVVADDRADSGFLIEPFLGNPQCDQALEHRHDEVPAAHAGIEAGQFLRHFRPAGKAASRRLPAWLRVEG